MLNSRVCQVNGGTAVYSDGEVSSHLRRRPPRRSEKPGKWDSPMLRCCQAWQI